MLRRCMRDRHCAEITYCAHGNDEETERIVEPDALTFQSGLWQRVAVCRLRRGVCTFRVDRVVRATALGEFSAVPQNPSVAVHNLDTLWAAPNRSAAVWLDPSIAGSVREHQGDWMKWGEAADGGLVARLQ